MRIYQMAILLIPIVASAVGCRTAAKVLLVALDVVDFESSSDVDPAILKRKGIEPGSKEHRRLRAQDEMRRELDSTMERIGNSY